MKYIVIKNRNNANYQDSQNNLYVITEVNDNVTAVGANVTITTDISAYTPLQSYIAEQAANLERAKNKAISKLENDLANIFAAGLSIDGPTGTLLLPATPSDVSAFTQGSVLLGLAGLPDDTMVSVAFGRGVMDAQKVLHDMTVAQYKALILIYGQTIGAMQGVVATKVAQISAATTVAEVKAVV